MMVHCNSDSTRVCRAGQNVWELRITYVFWDSRQSWKCCTGLRILYKALKRFSKWNLLHVVSLIQPFTSGVENIILKQMFWVSCYLLVGWRGCNPNVCLFLWCCFADRNIHETASGFQEVYWGSSTTTDLSCDWCKILPSQAARDTPQFPSLL